MSTVTLGGTVTRTERVDVNVNRNEVMQAAYNEMRNDELAAVVRLRIVKNLRDNDPSLKDCQYNRWNNCWEKFDYVDYHKNEDVYDIVRPLNDAELLAISMVDDIERQLLKQE